MGLSQRLVLALSAVLLLPAPSGRAAVAPARTIETTLYDSGFANGDNAFNGMGRTADGKLVYVISTHKTESHAQLYTFDPGTMKITHVADMGQAVGDGGKKILPHGKVHVDLIEHHGKLYSATHTAFMKAEGGAELPGQAKGLGPYPGGVFFSFDPATRRIVNLARAPEGEGIITFAMDRDRERLYGLTWPSGLFVTHDLKTHETRNLGPVFGKAETVKEAGRMPICRALAVDPRDGAVYFSNSLGEIWAYRYAQQTIAKLADASLVDRGQPDLWRNAVWYPREEVFVGLLNGSSMLYTFNPRSKVIRLITPLYPAADRARGDLPATQPVGFPAKSATLGFRLGEGGTLYYLASPHGVGLGEAKRTGTGLSLITYHLPSRTYRDHGSLRLRDGRVPHFSQSLEVIGEYGYTLAWIGGGLQLLRFPLPPRNAIVADGHIAAEDRAEIEGVPTPPPLPAITSVAIGKNREVRVNGQAFFPLFAWAQPAEHYALLRRLGFNAFAGGGGRGGQACETAQAAGGYCVTPLSDGVKGHAAMLAYMQPDEPDLDIEEGHPRTAADAVVEQYRRIRSADASRPVFLNYSSGFMTVPSWTDAVTPAVKRAYYTTASRGADILSFDIYPIYQKNADDHLDWVATGVTQLRDYAGPGQPVFAFIETSKGSKWISYSQQKDVLPAFTRAEVWMAIIRGATGIGYFTHAWHPEYKSFAPGREMIRELKRTNDQIGRLAPVLLDGKAMVGVRIATGNLPGEVLARRHAGELYLFVNNLDMQKRGGRFTLRVPGLAANTVVEVVDEGRTIAAGPGAFSDEFAPLDVHIYRIVGNHRRGS